MVLTDDYGILKEKDLRNYTKYLKNYEKFSGHHNGLVYWQCFPRENVEIILKDMGYSCEDVGWKDSMADLEILVWIRQGLYHQYSMRRSYTVTDYQKHFNTWRKLMNKEKYVCISGRYINHELTLEKNDIHFWIFDQLKTKRGAASYFD